MSDRPGVIITFYSYKGGTGRSMAVANIAWILAAAGKRVLVIDWDLEAPGLHRYFRPFLIDRELSASDGVIEFVTEFTDEVVTPSQENLSADWYKPFADITRYALSINFPFPAPGKIDMIPAGRQGETYSARVNAFQWQRFYERLGGSALLDETKERLREKYDYILIDSRTGVSDTAGICTVKMPDILVVCFTYNVQSIEGAAAVTQSVLRNRKGIDSPGSSMNDLRGMEIFPIPMRVDPSEKEKLQVRRGHAWSIFDSFLEHNSDPDRTRYWTAVEVPYIAYFSYEEVLSTISDLPGDPKNLLGSMIRVTEFLTHFEVSEFAQDLSVDDRNRYLRSYSTIREVPWFASAPSSDLGRLPIPGPHFVGREAELARLDAAWEDPATHVLTLVAFGGVGKSALVARWLDRMAADGWRGATRVLDWSFYSQGTKDRVTSAEPFIDHALRFFGDPDPKAGSLHDRGARLAHLARKERSLLVLDGIEPLQYPPGRPEIEGRLKDPGLAALLKGLAAGHPGLCVVTTRERIADLVGSPSTAPQMLLEELGPGAAMDLLRQLGVYGRESELRAAAEDYQRHALTLTLLGNFLRRAHGGDVRKRREIDLYRADEKQGGHAFRVIAAYARWLGEGPELAILRLLGLFDRPAEASALKALRAAPPIPGLTESLVDLANEDWQLATATLRDHSLLTVVDPREPETLDAHPLVRACFAEELESHRPAAWQEGNRRLYEHLRQVAPDLPDTLEAMQPLYAAIVHGCRAGRQQEALNEIFWRRVQRGDEFFSSKRLGALGTELTALAGFFDRPWSQPSSRLSVAEQGFVFSMAAFNLRALGRMAEAVEPMQRALEVSIARENWKEAASRASNLSELILTLGDVTGAVEFGEQSVELADRSGDTFQRIGKRTTLADALHQAGRWEESAAAFREVEAMQTEWQPRYPRLYSLQGFQYCDLLLSLAEPKAGSGLEGFAGSARPEEAEQFRKVCQEVLERASATLADGERWYPLLDVALDQLTLGRAYFGLSRIENDTAGLVQAAEHLNRAVDGFRRAGQEDFVPLGLLARAALRRCRSDVSGAAADLTEALEIAERGPMRLHECDAHLGWARLYQNQGDLATARRHLARARELVQETGYGRRAREIGWLERALAKESR